MSQRVEVKVEAGTKGFAEDKDAAKELRKDVILPALLENKTVVLDFSNVTSSTQSFVHALIGEPLQKFGEAVLGRMEFHACAPQIKTLVELVVDYSLSGFGASSEPMKVATLSKKRPSEKPVIAKPRRRKRS
jgi:uncharacterized protein DUF4325